MYNIIFASVPIIWYSLYDFEFDKSEFLKTPKHYCIGLKNLLFTDLVFWQWFCLGAFQAFLLLVICYFSQNFTLLPSGLSFDFWLNGQVTYFCIVLLANLKILQNFSNYHLIGEFLCLVMIVNFVLFYLMENYMPSIQELYHTFWMMYGAGVQCWLCVVIAVGMLWTTDKMLHETWTWAHGWWKKRGRGG